MTALTAQLGVKNEVTYGTGVTVDKFFEFNSETVNGVYQRVTSNGVRIGSRVARSDRFVPYMVGAAGNIVMDVPTKGFGFWLVHMLGSVATAGPTDSNYTHTGTVGSLAGDYFTAQIGRPFNPSGTAQAFTYEGGKVASWELACDVDGMLVATFNCDFEEEKTGVALATASYPSSYNVMNWVGGSVTVGGVATELRNFRVAMDNKLDTGRRFLRGGALKKEPTESDLRDVTWSFDMEFADLTQFNRVASATIAGALAQIVATFQGPVIHAGATYPSLVITIPAARFDADTFNMSGPADLTQSVSGVGLWDGTNSPVTIAYTTTDTTP